MGVDDRVFLARYEFPNPGEGFQFSKAVSTKDSGGNYTPIDPKPAVFIDFLAGFPIDCVEMLVFLGEYSSAPTGGVTKINVQEGKGATAPVWDGLNSKIFTWPEPEKILLNLTALATKNVCVIMAENIDDPKPTKAHWWLRVLMAARSRTVNRKGQVTDPGQKFPIPGEFVGLGVRMMPGEYWGKQKSNPFIYSGNWLDSVYLTGGRVIEVIAPTDTVAYPTYEVAWRKDKIIVRPSDFAEYRVDDRVSILKDVATEKKTQLWKDSDMKSGCEKETWMIVPLAFYGLEKGA